MSAALPAPWQDHDIKASILSQTLRSASCGFGIARKEPLPNFTVGALIKKEIASGAVRSYSLNNDEIHSEWYVLSVQRGDDRRGGSLRVHQLANVGDLIRYIPLRTPLSWSRQKIPTHRRRHRDHAHARDPPQACEAIASTEPTGLSYALSQTYSLSARACGPRVKNDCNHS